MFCGHPVPIPDADKKKNDIRYKLANTDKFCFYTGNAKIDGDMGTLER